jgi:hypothetical protein
VARLPAVLYALSAAIMAAGSLLHALALPQLDRALAGTALPLFYAGEFRALWLSDCASSMVLALVFALMAVRPAGRTRALAAALSLLPLLTAMSILATLGPFYPVWLLLTAGVAVLLGALLDNRAAVVRAAAGRLGAT